MWESHNVWENIKSGAGQWDHAAQRWGEVVSVDAIGKLTFGQRLEDGEGVRRADIWEKMV